MSTMNTMTRMTYYNEYNGYSDYNDYRDSNLDLGQQTLVNTSRHQQTDSDLDSIRNSCDVLYLFPGLGTVIASTF